MERYQEMSKMVTEEGEKISTAFLKGVYPLSEEGTDLKRKIENGTSEVSELPTVENPRSELFANFTSLKLDELFGSELMNIQVSKGCSHQCEFCAVSAEKKITMMPFPGIVKCAEQKRRVEAEILEEMQKYFDEIERQTGRDMDTVRSVKPFSEVKGEPLSDEEKSIIAKKVTEIYYHSDLRKLACKWAPNRDEQFEEEYLDRGPTWMIFDTFVPTGLYERRFGPVFGEINNYFDSDPFDYRDVNFLHENGDPADFGDAAEQLSSEVRPLYITTAGWSRKDKVAQRAAEKLVKLGRKRIFVIRLSVNPYEKRSIKDIGEYMADVRNSIETLLELKPQLIPIPDESNPEWMKAVEELKVFAKEKDVYAWKSTLSQYSGKMADESKKDTDRDVMACMPGYHIWPDGSVHIQKGDDSGVVSKGTRPVATGDKLWTKPRR